MAGSLAHGKELADTMKYGELVQKISDLVIFMNTVTTQRKIFKWLRAEGRLMHLEQNRTRVLMLLGSLPLMQHRYSPTLIKKQTNRILVTYKSKFYRCGRKHSGFCRSLFILDISMKSKKI